MMSIDQGRGMAIGAPELIILLLIIGPVFVLPIWALVDIVQQPDHAWEATGRNQTAWLLGLILTWFFGFGVVGAVVAIVYLTGPRQDLNRASDERPTMATPPQSSVESRPETRQTASVSDRLEELENLRQQGRISDEEYQRQRERLLNEL